MVLVVFEIVNLGKGSDRSVDTALILEGQDPVSPSAIESEKIAYLTFDDGPSGNTEKILQTLKEKCAVATFFLIGEQVTQETESTIKKAIRQGNAIGVHTYCHDAKVMYQNEKMFFEDYEKAASVIREVIGKEPELYRFPWGSNNRYVSYYVDSLHSKLKEKGVKCFDWNVSGEDSVGRNVAGSVILNNVKKDLTKYKQPIILLHDSAEMNETAQVLGQIIDYVRREGYQFGVLDNRDEYVFPAAWR